MAFDDPEERLPRLDRLEGFRPQETSLYRRVLLRTFSASGPAFAWVYACPEGGHWTKLSRVQEEYWNCRIHID